MNDSGYKTGDLARTGLFRVAIVGATSLIGKELKDLLSERNFPVLDVKLLDDEEAQGALESVGDEATFVQSVAPEQLEDIDFAFFASDSAFTRNTWTAAREHGCEIIDLSYALEDTAKLRAPWIDAELGREHKELVSAPVVVAHPAAAVLALLLLRLNKVGKILSANATILEPASERGRRGMDELHDQTVNLLSFQQMPTAIFGTQIAFSMTSGLGEEAKPSLREVENRIARHLKAISGDLFVQPSLLLVQAPVFHGHGFAIHVEIDTTLAVGDVEAALAGPHVEIMRAGESPNNVVVAGSDKVPVAVRADASNPRGLWIWATSDNFHVLTSQAIDVAEEMAAVRPRGKVQ